MDLEFIEILDSNVEDILDVTIVEERIKDEYEVFYNDQQIRSHITNLLQTRNPQFQNLSKRVDSYYDIITNIRNKDVDTSKVSLALVHPILDVSQYIYYIPDDDYEEDKEFEQNEKIKPVEFFSYLKQFHNLNHDVVNSYRSTSMKLYSLSRPFEPADTVSISLIDSDVRDLKQRYYRILGPQRDVYDGDKLSILGFSNTMKKTTETPTTISIDFDVYTKLRDKLKAGDTVTVVFNDFAYASGKKGDEGKFIESIQGRIDTSMNIVLNETIKLRNAIRTSLPIKHDDYFVFHADAKTRSDMPLFSKRSVFSKRKPFNITSQTLKGYDLFDIIKPSVASQAVFIEVDNIRSMNDIKNVVTKYGFDTDFLTEDLRPFIESLYTKNLPPRRIRDVHPVSLTYPHESVTVFLSDIDAVNNLSKMVKTTRARDRRFHQILEKFASSQNTRHRDNLVHNIKKYLETLQNRLAKEHTLSLKTDCTKPGVFVIAKEYKTLSALFADDGKDCYWDAKFDQTEYSIKSKDKDNTDSSTQAIEKKLLSLPRYQKMTAKSIEREARAIVKGRRKVQDGENAIFKNPTLNKTIVFVRKTIQGKQAWVKASTLDKCSDELPDFSDMKACFYDSYDKACKSLEEHRHAKLISKLKTAIETLKGFLHNEFYLRDDLPKLITLFKQVYDSQDFVRNKPFSKFHYDIDAHDQDLEGNDIEVTFEELMNHLEGQDIEFAPIAIQRPQGHDSESLTNEVISVLTRYLGFNLDKEITRFVNSKSEELPSSSSIEGEMVDKKKELMTKVNMELYNKNPEFRKKVDEKIEEKVKATFEDRIKKIHYEYICFSIALLNCLLMGLYPHTQIEKIVPGCASKYSMIGFPLAAKGTVKSLDGYLICVMKHLAIPDDIRYASLVDSKEQDIVSHVHSHVSQILSSTPNLNDLIESNKPNLFAKNDHIKKVTTGFLRDSFKPNFSFHSASSSSNPTIGFLKKLNDTIRSSKYAKMNYAKSAFISNSCCPDQITTDIDYFNYASSKDATLKEHIKKLQGSSINVAKFTKSYVPPLSPLSAKTPFVLPRVKHDLHQVKKVSPLMVVDNKHKVSVIDDDTFYNDKLLPMIREKYDKIVSILTRTIDDVNPSILYFIRDEIVNGMSENIMNIRNSLYTFVKVKLPFFIARVKNNMPYNNISNHPSNISNTNNDSNNKWKQIQKNVNMNTKFHTGFKDINIESLRNIPYFKHASTDESLYIKNVASIIDVFLTFLDDVLDVPLTKKMGTESYRISASIVNSALVSMYEYFDNTISDVTLVNKQVEELREKKKQDLINQYQVDDENRGLQIELRNIGLQNWATIFENLQNIDINAYANKREESDNYRMADNQGENADDDVEEDNDIVRGGDS